MTQPRVGDAEQFVGVDQHNRGLGQRLREGYLELAARDADRWIVVDNTDADLQQMVDTITDTVIKALDRHIVRDAAA